MYVMCMHMPTEAKEGGQIICSGDTVVVNHLTFLLGIKLGFSRRQVVPLTTEPPLQPQEMYSKRSKLRTEPRGGSACL